MTKDPLFIFLVGPMIFFEIFGPGAATGFLLVMILAILIPGVMLAIVLLGNALVGLTGKRDRSGRQPSKNR